MISSHERELERNNEGMIEGLDHILLFDGKVDGVHGDDVLLLAHFHGVHSFSIFLLHQKNLPKSSLSQTFQNRKIIHSNALLLQKILAQKINTESILFWKNGIFLTAIPLKDDQYLRLGPKHCIFAIHFHLLRTFEWTSLARRLFPGSCLGCPSFFPILQCEFVHLG